ncbi:hyaluronan-binding protein 2 [Esox lucius]|uniref:hyaluronan-binding protein 2 n=1 Tax=Esox lucius TaxID=8010 RepID=UPI001476F7FE|nr:hyaluronan-binding protein 2 [Esox lucius]
MKSKLLFSCLVLLLLILPVQLEKHKKHEKHEASEHGPSHGKHEKKKEKSPGRRRGRYEDIVKDPFFKVEDDPSEDDSDDAEWLYELQEPYGRCNPNPCLNNGVCEEKGKRRFKCDCPKPFRGKICERGIRRCKKGICGHGECVLTSKPPFFECKCKLPFLAPDCQKTAVCEPNPCKNGGKCTKDGMNFECLCPKGFSGQFCHVGPDDCYNVEDEGESYRGNVSETDDGDECLFWNSHFILQKGTDPFNDFEDDDGLGPHNYCRNPDGDKKPWCFIRMGQKLLWDFCDIRKCVKPTAAPEPPTGPKPTTGIPKPVPTIDEPILVIPSTDDPELTPGIPVSEPSIIEPELTPLADATPMPPVGPQPTTIPKPVPTPAKPVAGPVKPSTRPHSDQQFATCGKTQPKKAITRIYGGLKAIPGAQPWQLSLQVRPQGSIHSYRHICGAVLISSCWALTAGHCIEPKHQMQVVGGGLSLGKDEPTEQTIDVEKAIRHENYRETPAAVYNDIALLKLKGANGRCANESQFVRVACLPDGVFPDGTECTISGWGATEHSLYGSSNLLDAQVMLINQESCSDAEVYGTVLDTSMFCAGHMQGGVDSCQGDSGGPLTCNKQGTHVLYGIVSWGDQCGRQNKPGVYTRVSHFNNWIKSKIQAA